MIGFKNTEEGACTVTQGNGPGPLIADVDRILRENGADHTVISGSVIAVPFTEQLVIMIASEGPGLRFAVEVDTRLNLAALRAISRRFHASLTFGRLTPLPSRQEGCFILDHVRIIDESKGVRAYDVLFSLRLMLDIEATYLRVVNELGYDP